MSFFIDKHGRRKSPIALAACGAALLDLAVYFCTAALLAGPLYRTVSFGGETVTSMLHTTIITVISTLLCCLLFLLKDKRVVPYGFAGLAVILLMFCAAAWMLPQETRGSMLRLFLTVGLPPVLLGNAVSWPIYRRLRKAHPEYFVRKTISEELANLWEVTYYHRELRGDVLETLEALKARGYHIGIISNNASLYNVFNMLEEYGIRGCMEDVTVSSVTGYRKPHPEIFRISLRQMQTTAENCVYVGDTISRDIIGAKQAGFGKAVQIVSALSAQKDAATAADAEKPDLVIQNLLDMIPWLDQINPDMHIDEAQQSSGMFVPFF